MPNNVTLYHFTNDIHLPGCLREGLRFGVTPTRYVGHKIKFLKNTQWLTRDGRFEQSWANKARLKYDRTQNRLTIVIPESHIENLKHWTVLKDFMSEEMFAGLSSKGNPADWYVYLGRIPPSWIKKVDKKNPIKRKRRKK